MWKLFERNGKGKVLGLAISGSLLVLCLALAFAQKRSGPSLAGQERPRRAPATGSASIIVKAGDDLQAALNRAKPGDTITLEAGATFVGPFSLPNKAGDGWITIRTSAPDSSLPAANARITPAYSGVMPKIVSRGDGQPALRTLAGAHHFRFLGIEFKPINSAAMMYDVILLGDGSSAQNTLDLVPHHLIIDRCYIHADPAAALKRGIALNSAHTEIINSHISDFKGVGYDTQAIMGWNGPGPFRIINNYLEGAGENIMFGGAIAAIANLVPSDIEIRGNHLAKPVAWRGVWTVKNLFELKNARRVVVDSNLMTNNWANAQDGTALLFTVRSEDGAMPWATVEDVQFTNNIVRGAAGAINIYGSEGRGGHRLTVRNNLFEDINGPKWGGAGQFMTVTEWNGLTVEHNTILTTGNITKAYGKPVTNFVFRNNIVPQNEYGFHGDGRAPGMDSLRVYFPGAIVSNNAIIGGDPGRYRGHNVYPASLKQIKFVAVEAGDYRLRPDSPLRKSGTNGTDIGANIDAREFARNP